jgi:hypothetical protein
MTRVTVYYQATAESRVTVEVPDDWDRDEFDTIEEVARELAHEEFIPPLLCYHCSLYMDLGGWEQDESDKGVRRD